MKTYLGLLADGLVNDIVVLDDLLLHGVREILHTSILLLQVDVAQTAVEQDFTGVELEQKAELGVVDHGVASQVEKCVVEVGESLFKVAEEEIRDTLLEIRNGEVLI